MQGVRFGGGEFSGFRGQKRMLTVSTWCVGLGGWGKVRLALRGPFSEYKYLIRFHDLGEGIYSPLKKDDLKMG